MTGNIGFGRIPSVYDFLLALSTRCREMYGCAVTQKQQTFLWVCMSCMILFGQLMLSAVSAQSFGILSIAALSYMFRHSKLPFERLMGAAVCLLFEIYRPQKAHLVIDDTDRPRSKAVKALGFVFKTLCKVTKGYILAQNVVFVCLVTDRFTIPIAFGFYVPDPKIKEWQKKVKRLKKEAVAKKDLPIKPDRSYDYPSRIDMCEALLIEVRTLLTDVDKYLQRSILTYKSIVIKAVVADAAYMSPAMCRYVKKLFGVIFISQLKSNQKCLDQGVEISLSDNFAKLPVEKIKTKIRGKEVAVEMKSSHLVVVSHGCKLHVIAIRYADENNWRYVAATELTWRAKDIIQGYGLRWLIETFNEDWKQHGGWGQKAYQQGEEGACRGVFLSLLVDYFYLWHPAQVRLHRSGQPLSTTGSLVGRMQIEVVTLATLTALKQPDPVCYLEEIKKLIDQVFVFRPSRKHAAGNAGFEYPDVFDPNLSFETS